jgi:protein-S-isoprenylcysteine O-methyltransferase Ste14
MQSFAAARPLVLHDALARSLFDGVIAAWVVAELALRLRQRPSQRRPRAHRPDPTFLAVVLGVGGGVTLAQAAARGHVAPMPGGGWWPVIAGMGVAGAGIALRLWAIISLGRFFRCVVVIQPEHQLVERGPYRVLRHPSYTGLLVGVIGVSLALGDWVGLLAAFGLSLAGLLVRIRAEERALLAALGQQYADYMARTWRLVPGGW